MPSVIGNPILKGNSHVVVSCSLAQSSPVDKVIQGAFVGRVGVNPIEPVVANVTEGVVYGLALELPKCNNTKLTVVTKAESVLALTDGTQPPNGSKLLINADGLVSATGTITINGVVMSDPVSGYNRDGTLVPNCVWVSINSIEQAGGVAPTAAKSALSKA